MHPFPEFIIKWYKSNKRDLPWRNQNDPYLIWLSEILLQQTRVDQGLPYYHKFKEAFPTVFDLAAAPADEVLRLWQGLGYYSRARNLHQAAKLIVDHYNGELPKTYKELLNIKGVGQYTAAAIASFAYEEPVAVLDGNVTRVLCRYFGITDDISKSATQKTLIKLANEILPQTGSSIYNQGIMEFGSLHCAPAKPACDNCELNTTCIAFKTKEVSRIPFKGKKLVKKNRFFNFFVIKDEHMFLMRKRSEKDIWEGLYEFFLCESGENFTIEDIQNKLEVLNTDINNLVSVKDSSLYKHILTHQNLFAKFWIIEVKNLEKIDISEDFERYNIEQIKSLPKPVLINNYLNQHHF